MRHKNKILIIEDEYSICDILSYALKSECYEVLYKTTGKEGLSMIKIFQPDLIILDIMLPDFNGFDICKDIAEQYKVPVILLTARNDIVDKVLGFERGAYDYITKPFDIREVIARIKNILSRLEVNTKNGYQNQDIIRINKHITINKFSMVVYKNSTLIKLKPKEYDLLLMLSQNKGRVFTREQLLNSVWDIDFNGGLRTVDVHVRRLRKKLDTINDSSIIETVFGVGYKMRCFE